MNPDPLAKEVARSHTGRASSFCHEIVEPPFFSQVGLLLTLRCPVRCAHCMIRAGPHRTEEMELHYARDWLEQIAECGARSVGFTGGEPFYCWDKLLALSHAARRLGLGYTVVTNGFWADARSTAIEKLEQLEPSDVRVSTDIYHVRFIPIERVEHVFEACRALGIRCDLAMVYTRDTLTETERLARRVLQFAPLEMVQMAEVFPSGRGEQVASYRDGGQANRLPPRTPCLFGSVPYILPSGHVVACVGPAINLPRDENPLCLGCLQDESLAEIYAASQDNPILHGLRIWGARFWHRLIEAQGPRDALPKVYHSDCTCEACVALLAKPEIRTFLSRAMRSEALRSHVGRVRRGFLDE